MHPPDLPPFALASEEDTRISTNTGATAFSAPTNRSPKIAIQVCPGTSSPRITPTIKPPRIRMIRLISFHFLNKLMMSLS